MPGSLRRVAIALCALAVLGGVAAAQAEDWVAPTPRGAKPVAADRPGEAPPEQTAPRQIPQTTPWRQQPYRMKTWGRQRHRTQQYRPSIAKPGMPSAQPPSGAPDGVPR